MFRIGLFRRVDVGCVFVEYMCDVICLYVDVLIGYLESVFCFYGC